MTDRAKFDQNNRPSLLVVSNDGLRTPVELWADPTTHALVTSGSAGGGSAVTDGGSTVSSLNSTSTILTSGSAFTGTGEIVTSYSSVTVAVISNIASATDGLQLQQSSDNTNWDILDSYTVAANTGKTFGVQITGKYFRVVYTNGGTNQASFRLWTMYHTFMPNASSVRPQDNRSNDNDMQEVIGYGMAYNTATNDWSRVNGGGTDSGQYGSLVAGIRKEVAFTTTTVQAVGTTDVSNYKWVSIHVVTQGTSSTVNFQGSNDNTNWVSVALQSVGNATTAAAAATATAGVIYYGSINFRYFRLNVTGISAGTTSGVLEFSSIPGQYASIGSQSAVIGYPTAAATADALANPTVTQIGSLQESFNGTTWDRNRNNTTGALIAAGATSTQTVTLTTYNARSMVLVVNVSAYTSGTIGLAINGVSATSYNYALLSAITGLVATGVNTYRVGIGLTPAAGLVANDVLPRTVQLVVSGTFTATYGVDYVLGV